MAQLIDRVIQTRGEIERTFWAQATKLKNLLGAVHLQGVLEQV